MRVWIWSVAWLVGVSSHASAQAGNDRDVEAVESSDQAEASDTSGGDETSDTPGGDDANDPSAGATPDAASAGEPTTNDANADDDPESRRLGGVSVYDAEMEPRFAWDDRDHEFMGVLRIGFGMPYLVAIKYADGPLCEPTTEPEDQTFCARAGEPFLDLEAGFAFTHRLEVVGAVTLSLDEDPVALAKPRSFGVGVRGYTNDEGIVKGFFGARVVIDYTSSDADDWSNVDFGVRGDFGIQVDPIRWLGIFLQGAVGIRLLRGFTFLPEASAGLQIRFP